MTPQELKNSILQLAIQGKLVEQRPKEGTAEELLKQIQAEKQVLIKTGKIKKEKPLPEITEEEKPFDIPESWIAVRLGRICQLLDGEKREGESFPYLEAKYLRGKSEATILTTGKFIEKGTKTILVDGENSGEVFDITEDGYMGSTFKILFVPESLCLKYVLFFVQFHKETLRNSKKGAAIPHLNKEIFFNLVFPIPPLAEQKRIVAKIEELLPLIDRYEEAWTKLEEFNKRFPGDMQKSLLQMAIQGKLVEQRPEEGTGEELYTQIQAEKQALIKSGKIKKDKPLPEITDDEKPFDIPESWKWVYIGDLFQHNTGKALNGSDKSGNPYEYITTSNVYWNRFELEKLKTMLFTDAEIEKCTVQKGDLLVLEGGDCGRAAIWNYDFPMRIQNHIHRLRPYAEVCIEYFYHIFYLYKNAGLINGKGIAIQGLSANALHSLIVPLPPLAEQKRIVAKLEELLPLCERLK